MTKSTSVHHLGMIWLHGLGSDGQNMAGVAHYLSLPEEVTIQHVFLDAPYRPVTINQGYSCRAWYDIKGVSLVSREDSEGIIASTAMIHEAIDGLINRGISSDNIILAGFSQGGAMTFFAGLSYPKPLKALMSLSAYFPLREKFICHQPTTLPVFVGYGLQDDVVNPLWTMQSVDFLKEKGLSCITVNEYTMAHAICEKELIDMSAFIQSLTKGAI